MVAGGDVIDGGREGAGVLARRSLVSFRLGWALEAERCASLVFGGQLHDDRAYSEFDARNRPGLQPVLVAQLDAAVDHRVHHQPARERLVHIGHQFIALAEFRGDDSRVEFRRQYMSPATRRFDPAFGAGEIF